MRIYKTRSIAADACKNGRITMGGVQIKPSRTFKIGDQFSVRKGPITYTYQVNGVRDRGLGRPTKKDRREIETFMSDSYLDEIEWDDEE